jgi:hypothetical protein
LTHPRASDLELSVSRAPLDADLLGVLPGARDVFVRLDIEGEEGVKRLALCIKFHS